MRRSRRLELSSRHTEVTRSPDALRASGLLHVCSTTSTGPVDGLDPKGGEVAGHLVARCDLSQLGHLRGAPIFGLGAAGSESTP